MTNVRDVLLRKLREERTRVPPNLLGRQHSLGDKAYKSGHANFSAHGRMDFRGPLTGEVRKMIALQIMSIALLGSNSFPTWAENATENHHRIAQVSAVIYVDQDAVGLADGSSWANAFTDLHMGLMATQPGDSIWIAEGTYLASPRDNRDDTFLIDKELSLYGGFEGAESFVWERNGALHPTILSGEIGQPGMIDNSLHVVTIDPGFGVQVWLSDLQITHGKAESRGGGGCRVLSGDVSILSCRIRNNKGNRNGAGIYLSSASLMDVDDSTFERNTGGAIYISGVSNTLTLRHCGFFDNWSSYYGGAIESYVDTFLQDCRFWNNESTANGGALYCSGELQIDRCEFVGNLSGLSGGAVYHNGGYDANSLVANSVFLRNSAGWNGGAFLYNGNNSWDSSIMIANDDFLQNSAQNRGGAIAYDDDSYYLVQITLINSIVRRNRTINGGNLDGDQIQHVSWFQSISVNYCDLENLSTFAWGTVNVDLIPRFMRTRRDDLRLQANSPLVDAGSPSTAAILGSFQWDYLQRSRIQGLAADIGAFEVQ